MIKNVKSGNFDVIIAMFDLHWINNILAMYLHHKDTQFIWWGGWFTGKRVVDRVKLFLTNQKYASIFYTQQEKKRFIKAGVDENKLFVANNTIYVENRERCYEYPIKNKILFVGSLDTRKENHILVQAFYNIQNKIPKAINLIIIGEGKEKTNLVNTVNGLNMNDKVHFLGKINGNKLVDFYREAIVSVSFGQAGLSVLQSMGYGVPFLTKKNAISGGEKTNIINGINGVFCEDTVDSLQEKLLELCSDINYAKSLGKNAYDYYSNFCTIEHMARGIIEAIKMK